MGEKSKKRSSRNKDENTQNTFAQGAEEDWDKEIVGDQSLPTAQEGTFAAGATNIRQDAVTDNIKVTQKRNDWGEAKYEKASMNIKIEIMLPKKIFMCR